MNEGSLNQGPLFQIGGYHGCILICLARSHVVHVHELMLKNSSSSFPLVFKIMLQGLMFN